MKKNILMLAYTRYSTDARIRREAETLACQPGYEVLVFVPKEREFYRTYQLDSVNVLEADLRKYQGKSNFKYLISYLRFMIKSFLTCSKLVFQKKVDIVHVHNMPDFLVFAAIIPRLFGKRLILDVHDSMPETYFTKFNNKSRLIYKVLCWEEAICCKFVNKVICVNHPQSEELIKRGVEARKIGISMNVPDPKRFNLEEKERFGEKPGDTFKLVYHGTQAKRLGVDLTIKAVSTLVGKIPGLEFHIIGTGDDLEDFIKESIDLGVEKYIHFSKKIIPLEDLTKILAEMDMGVVANRKNIATELMLPVKMLEYIALNIPVIVPRLRAIEYYFSNEMVSYFEPDNVDSLARTILEAYKNETKRNAQAKTAKRFLERYGWGKHQMDLIKLYQEL